MSNEELDLSHGACSHRSQDSCRAVRLWYPCVGGSEVHWVYGPVWCFVVDLGWLIGAMPPLGEVQCSATLGISPPEAANLCICQSRIVCCSLGQPRICKWQGRCVRSISSFRRLNLLGLRCGGMLLPTLTECPSRKLCCVIPRGWRSH